MPVSRLRKNRYKGKGAKERARKMRRLAKKIYEARMAQFSTSLPNFSNAAGSADHFQPALNTNADPAADTTAPGMNSAEDTDE